MRSNLIKAMIIAGAALFLGACSGMSTNTCFSEGCQSLDGHGSGNATKVNFGGSGIGNSFNQYSSDLLHN